MEKIVFTNGCFDLLHPGHVDLLARARALGTKLIVGINSDDSVRKIKGAARPFQTAAARAEILRALAAVDEVRVFDDLTPEKLIREIRPDVLVKGGDWQRSEIIGADFVESYGGQVHSLRLKDDYSSSRIVAKIQNAKNENIGNTGNIEKNENVKLGGNPSADFSAEDFPAAGKERRTIAARALAAHLATFQRIAAQDIANIEECGELIYETLRGGAKLLFCGNGGSAADAQHLAAEFVGRYETERPAFPAIALTTDTSALTALGNDYGFERIFARQVEALAAPGDLLVALSTSGNSPNVVQAVMTARAKGCRVLGMTGATGKKLAALCDAAVLVPSEKTARIQEAHITVGHIWCEMLDARVSAE